MLHPVWREYLQLISFFASVAGLYILFNRHSKQSEESETADHILFSMTFAYWIVHCIAVGAQKWIMPDWEAMLLSLKMTAALSYLLTFSCALSLPLNSISTARQRATK